MKKIYLLIGLSLLMLTSCGKQEITPKQQTNTFNEFEPTQEPQKKVNLEYIITNPKETIKIHYFNKYQEGTNPILCEISKNIVIYDDIYNSIENGHYMDKFLCVNYAENKGGYLNTFNSGIYAYLLNETKDEEFSFETNYYPNVTEIVGHFYKDGKEVKINKDELSKKVDESFYISDDDIDNLYNKNIYEYYGFDEMYVFVNVKDKYVIGYHTKKLNDDYRIEITTCYDYKTLNKDFGINKFSDFTKDFFVNNFTNYTFEECEGLKTSYKEIELNGQKTFMILDKYQGEYSEQNFECFQNYEPNLEDEMKIVGYSTIENLEEYYKGKIVDYNTYVELTKTLNLEQTYDNEDQNYLIILYGNPHSFFEFDLAHIEENEDNISLFYREDNYGLMGSGSGKYIVIPTTKEVGTKIELNKCLTEDDVKDIGNYAKVKEYLMTVDKPVIYFYPTKNNTKVDVTLDFNGKLTCTYPKYNNSWKIIANKDGTIFDEKGLSYNYLYWEGIPNNKFNMSKGYCVKGENTAQFLEEKLSELGLTRKEANEFIVYWLPKMETNKYNVITFQDKDYIDNAKLNINPNPDTLIRVFMTYYSSDKYVDIEPQKLITPTRKGFTVVEWGGSELNK